MVINTRVCVGCGEIFKPSSRHKNCPPCRSKNSKVPCPECGELKSHRSNVCIRCIPSLEGENNPRWKGGKTEHSKGYIMLKRPLHPHANPASGSYIMQHRIVMEESLGRYLTREETVHHLNGVKSDNRIENLELWSKSHPQGQRVRDKVEWAKEILNKYGDEYQHLE